MNVAHSDVQAFQRTDSLTGQFHPVVKEFKELIEGDPNLYMGFVEMFEQIPNESRYMLDAAGKPQVRNKTLISSPWLRQI